MAKVNVVNKQVRMDLDDIIKYQLITHCYINRILLSDLDLDCLTSLGKTGESELTDFCVYMAEKRLQHKLKNWKPTKSSERMPDASPQTIRNVLIKVEKENLIVKSGKGRKRISLNPDLKIQTSNSILLNYKIVHVAAEETN
jgi:hypothetical protein